MRILVCIMMVVWVAACTAGQGNVNRIGGGRDDLKESPCACGPVIGQPNNNHAEG